MSTTDSGTENPTDDAPDGWTRTSELEWHHDSGALVRIRACFPVRSAADCNQATHCDATGHYEVLFHDSPLPSTPEEIATVGTKIAAIDAARDELKTRN
jgi:hypothetical protein